jgi:uncharacterized protein (TIGR02270 family)
LPRVLDHIVEQHAENAAFLWLLRDKAVDAPHYDQTDLANLDERLEANLDGLSVAGEDGWRVARTALTQHQEAGELFTAGVLALESGDPTRIDPVAAVGEAVEGARRGLSGAIGWTSPRALKLTVRRWLDGDDPFGRYLGLVACSHYRVDPGPRLAGWLDDPSPIVRSRALRLAGELGRTDVAPRLKARTAEDTDGGCLFWASWSAGLLGCADGLWSLVSTAESGNAFAERALEAAVRRAAHEEAKGWIGRWSKGCPADLRRAVRAAGILGDSAAVPWLIQQMDNLPVARLAGESFALVTGVDLTIDRLDGGAPGGFAAGPSDDSDDEDVGLDPDENLPWPDPNLVAGWWAAGAGCLPPGQRYILGRAIDQEACLEAQRRGYQRQRRAAALELANLQPDRPLANWRARRV